MVACTTGVFFGRANVFAKGCYFYSPQYSSVIKSKTEATTYEHKQAAFARPKYACTAGY